MDVRLKVLSGAHAGKEINVKKARFLIGRADDCHLRAGSDLISRHHCAIQVESSNLFVEDFGSKNGTLLNGRRIDGKHVIQSGDQIKVGPLEFAVEVHNQSPASTPAAPAAKPASDNSKVIVPTGTPEDDISNWLGESSTIGIAETRSLKFTDTDRIETPLPLVEPVAEAPAPAAQEATKTTAVPPPKGEPGKMKRVEPPKAKDSREAAANILKQMAKRK